MNRSAPWRRRYKCAEACTTCKRRKERCDGNRPCARCIQRRVEDSCQYRLRQQSLSERDGTHEGNNLILPDAAALTGARTDGQQLERPVERPRDHDAPTSRATGDTIPPAETRLLLDAKGKYMFLGDSANLSFLRTIRNLVANCIGSCSFVDDPFREQMVESVPQRPANWLQTTARQPPPKPDYNRAAYLICRFSQATNCVLDLFNEGELLGNLPSWLDGQLMHDEVWSPTYFLVFAVGAQTCPEDQDETADIYFNHGRLLTTSNLTEDPSIATLQATLIITMYLLGACRRNAAFMHLGTAVQAAYALGIHRADIASLFPPAECQIRERLWKALRTLDMFLSASLGRPPSTEETRDTEREEGYSASTDLCAIFEHILTDVYARRMITIETVQKISQHHRRWTLRYQRDLDADRVNLEDSFEGPAPNLGLIHVKTAYYWTIMLLTRPYFVEYMSRRIAQKSRMASDGEPASGPGTPANQVLVHACVNSAMSTVNILKVLLTSKEVAKRLPFVVNSLFVSGLVLGFGLFGDLYETYALDDGLKTAFKVLSLFPHDAIARRNLAILEMLLDACNIYVRRQKDETMARHANLVSGMFGQVDNGDRTKPRIPAGRHQHGMGVYARNLSDTPSHQTSDAISLGVTNEVEIIDATAPTTTHPPHSSDINAVILDPDISPFHYDFSVPGAMSPDTLWFGPYEENVPLVSTFDSRTFNL